MTRQERDRRLAREQLQSEREPQRRAGAHGARTRVAGSRQVHERRRRTRAATPPRPTEFMNADPYESIIPENA